MSKLINWFKLHNNYFKILTNTPNFEGINYFLINR